MHDAASLRVEELSSALDGRRVEPARHRRLSHDLRRAQQTLGQLRDDGVDGQRLEAELERSPDRPGEAGVRRHGLAHEGQALGASADVAKGGGNMGGLDVDDPVAEARLRAGAPVVDLVGMEDHHLTRPADPRRAAVVEDLQARIGRADRVGVVTMLCVRLAGEPGAEQLDTADGSRAGDPARGRPPARSFKTLGPRSGVVVSHEEGLGVGHRGVLGGLPCLFGVTTGMGVMLFVVPLGLGSLVLGHPLALTALRWGGAAFLLWLAWKIATSGGAEATAERRPVGFVEAAMFQWVNPKSWLVSVSAAGTYLGAESGSAVAQAALLGGLFFLAAWPSCFVWLAFGATVQRLLRSRRALRAFNITLGALLALSVLLIVR